MKTLLILLLFAFTLKANNLPASDNNSSQIDFSVIISGGVSLGAYESGYNWAMIKMLSKLKSTHLNVTPNLSSVAGASAGSINGLLTAMYWCQKESVPYKNGVDDNLFYETWVNLGIDDLIIKGRDPENKSTLLTRKELRNKADQMMEHLSKPIYRNGCEVPMGFAVTKVTPIVEEFDGIKIKNQNFSIPFTFKVNNSRASIHNRKMDPDSTAFYLSIPGIDKDKTKVVDVLFASSAFPGAFQQVKLKYQYKGKKGSAYFIDGGAYDNIPLQLATELYPDAKLYLFMNPGNMRKEAVVDEEEEEEKPVGFLHANLSPLTSSVEIFQQMKLYQAINLYFRNHPERQLILSSRFHPLTGGYLEHFGAFIDKNFRIYDYHVGVYDAIYHLAHRLRTSKRGVFATRSQIEAMDILMRNLSIEKNEEAVKAYRFFLATEFKHTKPATDNRYFAIYSAINTDLPDAKRYSNDEFKKFLSKLDLRYLDLEKDSSLLYAKKHLDNWGKRGLGRVVNRVTILENERAEIYPDHADTAAAINIAAWGASAPLYKKEGWDLFPINAPKDKGKEELRTALRFLPYEIANDSTDGGLSFAYKAYWRHDMGYFNGLEFKPSYNLDDKNGDHIRFDVNLYKDINDFIKIGGGISGFGDMESSFYKEDTAYGANVYVDFLDIFRATYVKRHGDLEDNTYFYLGIGNIPGLIYWLNR